MLQRMRSARVAFAEPADIEKVVLACDLYAAGVVFRVIGCLAPGFVAV